MAIQLSTNILKWMVELTSLKKKKAIDFLHHC